MSIKKVRGNGKEREDFPPEYFRLRAHHNWCDISPLSLDSPFRPVKNFSSINSSTNYASNGKKMATFEFDDILNSYVKYECCKMLKFVQLNFAEVREPTPEM
jgi:hypothetical protein